MERIDTFGCSGSVWILWDDQSLEIKTDNGPRHVLAIEGVSVVVKSYNRSWASAIVNDTIVVAVAAGSCWRFERWLRQYSLS